jgi:hypothetical protein
MKERCRDMNIETPHRIPQKKVVYLFSNRTLSIHAKIAVQFEVSIQIGGFVVAFSVPFVCANIAVLKHLWLDTSIQRLLFSFGGGYRRRGLRLSLPVLYFSLCALSFSLIGPSIFTLPAAKMALVLEPNSLTP